MKKYSYLLAGLFIVSLTGCTPEARNMSDYDRNNQQKGNLNNHPSYKMIDPSLNDSGDSPRMKDGYGSQD